MKPLAERLDIAGLNFEGLMYRNYKPDKVSRGCRGAVMP